MLRSPICLVFSVVVCLGLVAPCARAEGASQVAERAFATRIVGVKGFDYVAEVTPNLLRGSQPDADGVAWLKQRGVKTVINLRRFHGVSERTRVEAAGMRYVHIPLEASAPPKPQQLSYFLQLVNDPNQAPLFVHCAQGVDRTGTMLAVYRMEAQGWSNAEAFAEMLSFGAHRIWLDLRRYVRSYRVGMPKLVATQPSR